MKIMQQGELHEIESHVKVGHDAAAVWKKQKKECYIKLFSYHAKRPL